MNDFEIVFTKLAEASSEIARSPQEASETELAEIDELRELAASMTVAEPFTFTTA